MTEREHMRVSRLGPLPTGVSGRYWRPVSGPVCVCLSSFVSLALEILLMYFGAPSNEAIMPVRNICQENKPRI